MKQKHTHRGHCQACGRLQAHNVRELAKHGYTRKGFGYFVGTCYGSEHKPMEQERKLTDATIRDLRKWEKRHTELAEEFKSGKLVPKFALSRHKRDANFNRLEIPYAEGTQWEKEDALNAEISRHKMEASSARRHREYLAALLKQVHGKKMVAVKHQEVIEVKVGTKFPWQNRNFEVKSLGRGGFSGRVTWCTAADVDDPNTKPIGISIKQVRMILRSGD